MALPVEDACDCSCFVLRSLFTCAGLRGVACLEDGVGDFALCVCGVAAVVAVANVVDDVVADAAAATAVAGVDGRLV